MARISRRAERQSSSSTNNIPQHDAIYQPGFGLAAATRYKAAHRLDLFFPSCVGYGNGTGWYVRSTMNE
ncbi:hypothetical protein BOTNAR_0001g00140 [Botryotinia narcissicola]|uniref:Uncharacterized protein n=1 Tax=Botryotinia narcissicola TaxID=278944 RepID=A0A4Z1JFL6_9HELO|nr:hypothetical protein BOTNAR_0001g00140 [Botryotinia narcissicola]